MVDTGEVAYEPPAAAEDPLDGAAGGSMTGEPVEPVVAPDDPLDGTSDRDTV